MIESVFTALRSEGRAALIPYVTAGHPHVDSTVPLLEALADRGADVLELGIPFSDPLADGPTIQQSSFRALANGMSVARVLEDLSRFRARRDTPVVLFTYLNPVVRFGFERFLAAAVDAGANGLLLTDLPLGSDSALEDAVAASPLDFIRLVAPTTDTQRAQEVARAGSGFLYYISRTGVTGAQSELPSGLEAEVRRIREVVDLPVAVGFGISTPEQAGRVGAIADGVVVGSALVRTLEQEGVEAGAAFIASLRAALG
ncbi:MAG: tryptophan synthase subunit alpha [Gemmatimonadetes bacterium]|nr:tryptophan synthase subunit alpha [Gemmatimonadota bacterium]MDA1102860.1 tryptophan synthase subunit alpha [Gemmatimonadota bacterium]